MALVFLSRAIWNDHMYKFISEFYESFPHLTYCAKLKGMLGELIELNNTMREEEKLRGPRPMTPEEKKNYEEDKKSLTGISSLFLDSFRPFATRLKACDESLLRESRCFFSDIWRLQMSGLVLILKVENQRV